MAEPDGRSDRDLVERFRAGDREAFATLYHRHFPAVFRFALYMTGDRIRAGEITQDAFVWLVHHAAEFDQDRGELAAFLGGVSRKLLHSRQRSDRRWSPIEDAGPGLRARGSEAEFAAGLEREQETAALRQAIAALPERYREAVVLCDLHGKSYEEAAGEMECAVGTVRSRLHRARELLVRKFQVRRVGQRV